MTKTKIILAPTWELAENVNAEITVEAEYGAMVKEGTVYTAAHHQPNGPFAGNHVVAGGRPAPCNDADIPEMSEGTILVSHLDLDTIGGIMRTRGAGSFGEFASFWTLAEFVDVNGPHKLGESGASSGDIERLYAWWAYSKGMPRFSRDVMSDITDVVNAAISHIGDILWGHEPALAAGKTSREDEAALNCRTFRSVVQGFRYPDCGVIERVCGAGEFVNHLYVTPDGYVGEMVVALNTGTGAITISRANPDPAISCRAIAQALWGPTAGGHDGIAGGPRGRVMTFEDLTAAMDEVSRRVIAFNHKEV